MIVLLIYDIPSDRVRNKVADICLDYGLLRIQYSAFMGELSRNRQGEIIQKLKRRIGKKEADVQLFPVCEKDLALRKQIIVREQPPSGSPQETSYVKGGSGDKAEAAGEPPATAGLREEQK